jgi:glycosyltransferase involved in cell wall biosynthesis
VPAAQLVTVVVPARNERRHLPAQLGALARQTYERPWEVVVVDDGSTDGTGDTARSFAAALPSLRVVATPRRGLNHARNTGTAAARGEIVAFCDADDVVRPGWLSAIVAEVERGPADIVGGQLDLGSLNGGVHRSWRHKGSWTGKRVAGRFLEYVPGGNCAMRTAVARDVGWDEAFTFGGADAEFSWRVQHLGLRIGYAPGAVVRVRDPEQFSELARQFYGYGSGQPRLYARERHRGWPRSDTRGALREWAWLIFALPAQLGSSRRRGRWACVAGMRAGRLRGSVRARVLYL